MPEDLEVRKILSKTSLEIYSTSPSHHSEALPTFFYFALSGEESLALDPFNQPVNFLGDAPIRRVSFTLPYHGGELSNTEAVNQWGVQLLKGHDWLTPFLADAQKNIIDLIDDGYVDPEKMAVGGLSRGGFIATHLAALEPRIKTILGFAPLTQIGWMQDWRHQADVNLAKSYDLIHVVNKLPGRNLRYYIGNRDLRVGTSACYEFIDQLADYSYHNGFRSPPVEMIITPSVGHKGHGTLPHIFHEGADWIKSQLL